MSIALGIVCGLLLPHAPILLEEIAGSEFGKVLLTRAAVADIAELFRELDVQTLVLVGPHGPAFSDAFTMHQGPYHGNFAAFGREDVNLTVQLAEELSNQILQEVEDEGLPISPFDSYLAERFNLSIALDHGAMVPLVLLRERGINLPLVILNPSGLGLVDHYRFGMAVARAASTSGQRVAFVASGDLSHSPTGAEYDSRMMQWLRSGDIVSIVNIDSDLLSESAQCGHKPICMMLGALDQKNWRARGLFYEAPFGVGYGAAGFEVVAGQPLVGLEDILVARTVQASARRKAEPLLVSLARSAAEEYVRWGTVWTPPELDELHHSKAVFVSIKKHGELRGCIGTVEPEYETLGLEIVQRAIAACSADPRFDPVEENELDDLEYSVDVLSTPELVAEYTELDPAKYGIIVESRGRRGLLLPALPGIDSVQEQLAIACRKADINLSPDADVFRFTVDRHEL